MPGNRVIFTPVIEGLYVRALKGRVSPGLKQQLRELGLDLDLPLPSAFPVVQWQKCLRVTAEALFPELPLDEALWQLGKLHVEGVGRTLLGRAMFALMRAQGPRRALQQLTRSFRATDNYSETRVTELGPGRYELWTNAVVGEVTAYTEGLFVALLTRAGAREVRATCIHTDAAGITHLLQWEA